MKFFTNLKKIRKLIILLITTILINQLINPYNLYVQSRRPENYRLRTNLEFRCKLLGTRITANDLVCRKNKTFNFND